MILFPLFFVLGVIFTIATQTAVDCLRIEKRRKAERNRRYRQRRQWHRIPTIDGVLA